MLHGKILRSIGKRACLGIHPDKGILFPSPRTLAIVGQDEIPESVLVASVTQIMVHQFKGMFACSPVEATPSAFAFRTHIVPLGMFLAQYGERLAAFPLECHAAYVFLQLRVGSNLLHVVHTVGVERPEIKLHLRMFLSERGTQIVTIEPHRSLGRPCTTGVRRVAVCLILIYHHIYIHPLFLVSVDKLTEIIGIRLQVTRVLYKVVRGSQLAREFIPSPTDQFHFIRIHLIVHITVKDVIHLFGHVVELAAQHRIISRDFHPTGWTPRRCPERQSGIILLCRTYEGDDGLFVAVYIEITQFQIPGHLVATIPRTGIVVGVHGNTPTGNTQIPLRRKYVFQYLVLFVTGQHAQCVPIQFIKRGTPRLEFHNRCHMLFHRHMGIRSLLGHLHRRRFPRISFRTGIPRE